MFDLAMSIAAFLFLILVSILSGFLAAVIWGGYFALVIVYFVVERIRVVFETVCIIASCITSYDWKGEKK